MTCTPIAASLVFAQVSAFFGIDIDESFPADLLLSTFPEHPWDPKMDAGCMGATVSRSKHTGELMILQWDRMTVKKGATAPSPTQIRPVQLVKGHDGKFRTRCGHRVSGVDVSILRKDTVELRWFSAQRLTELVKAW